MSSDINPPVDPLASAITTAPEVPAPEPTTPASPPVPSVWPVRLDYAILVMLLILSFFAASYPAANSDLWLNLAIGKQISEGNLPFGGDPFSWATEAVGGEPAVYWTHHAWLFSWLVYH